MNFDASTIAVQSVHRVVRQVRVSELEDGDWRPILAKQKLQSGIEAVVTSRGQSCGSTQLVWVSEMKTGVSGQN